MVSISRKDLTNSSTLRDAMVTHETRLQSKGILVVSTVHARVKYLSAAIFRDITQQSEPYRFSCLPFVGLFRSPAIKMCKCFTVVRSSAKEKTRMKEK